MNTEAKSNSKKKFVLEQKSMPYEKYSNINHDKLLLYCIWKLKSNNFEVLEPDVGILAFKLFPKKFSLVGYTDFPDLVKARNTLWHLYDKSKGWIKGRPRTDFSLTEIGEVIAKKTIESIEKGIVTGSLIVKSKGDLQERKQVKEIKWIKNSDAYKKFIENKKNEINWKNIIDLLKITSDTPISFAESKLKKISIYAEDLNEKVVLEFLEFLKRNFDKIKNRD